MGVLASRVYQEPYIDSTLTQTLKEYSYLAVKELLGLTIKEYLDLTTLEREIYIKYLEPIAEEKQRAMAEAEAATNNIPGVDNDFTSQHQI